MYAARAAKPKLSLSMSAVHNASSRPAPARSLLSPVSPTPMSARRDYTTLRAPTTCAYANTGTSKSILKKDKHATATSKRIHFENTPTVYCVTPIDNKDEYYGRYVKMSRDERRWGMHS